MKKKTYFFDMDGTLVDSMMRGWNDVILKYLNDREIKYQESIIVDLVTLGFMGISKFFVENLGVDKTPEELYDYFMVALEPLYQNEYPAKEGAVEAIQKLKAEGVSVNVISGSPMRFVIPCLKRLGLYELLDNVFSLEEFNLTKSDKELFLKLAQKMGAAPEECVVVDDSVNALKTAKSAGLQTVGIYEEAVKNSWADVCAVADRSILNFTELV